MGKRAQLKRQKQLEEENSRKQTFEQIRRSRQPWARFWRRPDFWIYTICVILIGIFPFAGPKLTRDKPAKPATVINAVIHTSMGDIEVELYPKDAPRTVENFIALARQGYYNNLTWHRVIKEFMIQGGDPNGDGTGGQSAFGSAFPDEINPKSLDLSDEQIAQLQSQGYRYDFALNSHKVDAGAVAMANSGPNTNGSQFFIVTEQPQPHLNGKHTVFGNVKKGMEVVRAIASVEADERDKPKEPVYITSVEVK